MAQYISSIKRNKIPLCISLLLTLLIIFEWIFSGSFTFGATKTLVAKYDNWNSFVVDGYRISGNTFISEKKKSYIIVPIQGDEDCLQLDIHAVDNIKCGVEIYYLDDEDDYVKYEREQYSFSKEGTTLNIKLPRQENDIKLVITGNKNKEIEISSISLYKNVVSLNKKLIVYAIVWGLFLFVLFYIFIKKIVKLQLCASNIRSFFTVLLIGQFAFFIINILSRNYYWGSYFSVASTDNYMDHFNMLLLLKNHDPYYAYASYPAMCFLILKAFYWILPDSVQLLQTSSGLRENDIAMFYFGILVLLCIAIVYVLFRKYLDCFEKENLYSWLLILSGPFIYTIQRGNIILLAFCGLLVYTRYYDSEDKKKR